MSTFLMSLFIEDFILSSFDMFFLYIRLVNYLKKPMALYYAENMRQRLLTEKIIKNALNIVGLKILNAFFQLSIVIYI